MEQRKNNASETASGMQYITRAGRLRAGRPVINESRPRGHWRSKWHQPTYDYHKTHRVHTTCDSIRWTCFCCRSRPLQLVNLVNALNGTMRWIHLLCVRITHLNETKRTWQCTDKKFTKHLSHSTLIYVLLNKESLIKDAPLYKESCYQT